MTTATSTPQPTPKADSKTDWQPLIQFFLMVISGGAMGAIITAYVQDYRNRVPTIYYAVQQDKIFNATGAGEALKATVTIMQDDKPLSFTNLSLIKIRFKNNTGKDYGTLKFGTILPQGYEIIRFDYTSHDRLHKIIADENPTPANPLPGLDFTADPFNRNNDYTLTLYVHSSGSPIEADQVTMSSKESVKLVKKANVDESPPLSLWAYITSAVVTVGLVGWLTNILAAIQEQRTRKKVGAELLKALSESHRLWMDDLEQKERKLRAEVRKKIDAEEEQQRRDSSGGPD